MVKEDLPKNYAANSVKNSCKPVNPLTKLKIDKFSPQIPVERDSSKPKETRKEEATQPKLPKFFQGHRTSNNRSA